MPATEVDVRAAKIGDTSAFERLIRTHQSRVHAIAVAVTGSPEDAEEVAQAAFVVAWGQLDDLRDERQFSSWLRIITRNLALKHIRGNGRRRRLEARLDVRQPHPDPEAATLAAEDRSRLRAALHALGSDDREVLLLAYHAELSAPEIARVVDASPSAVRKRLQRARERLAVEIEGAPGEHLRLGRLGPAFAAAVLGGIAAPARARRPRLGRRLGGFAVLSVLVAACLVFVLGRASSSSARTDGESAPFTARADDGGPSWATWLDSAARSESMPWNTGSTERITLELRPSATALPRVTLYDGRGPYAYFPMVEEAPLPDHPAVMELQRVLDEEAASVGLVRVSSTALLELAGDDFPVGSVPTDDPWFDLMALELERRRLVQAYWQRASLPVEERDSVPAPNNGSLVDYLERSLERWGHDDAAPYLQLAYADAVVDPLLGTPARRSAAVEALVHLLEETDDVRVQGEIIERLGEVVWFEPPSMDVPAFIELARRLPVPASRLARQFLFRRALLMHEPRDAVEHAERFREAVRSECADPLATWPHLCDDWRRDADAFVGRAHSLDGTSPKHWRPTLLAAGWTCYGAYTGPPRESRVTLVFDGSWRREGSWVGASKLTRCIDEALSSMPIPEGEVVVELTVEAEERQHGDYPDVL